MKLLLTGGAGFIGSNVVHHIIDRPEVERLVNLDCLTYAGHPENLAGVAEHPKYCFGRSISATKRAWFESGATARRHPRAPPGRRVPRGPLDLRPGAISSTRTWWAPSTCSSCRNLWLTPSPRPAFRVRNSALRVRMSVSSRFDGRGVRQPGPHRLLHRNNALRAQFPLLGQQGRQRHARPGLPPHLRAAGGHHNARTTTARISSPRNSSRSSSRACWAGSQSRSTATG